MIIRLLCRGRASRNDNFFGMRSKWNSFFWHDTLTLIIKHLWPNYKLWHLKIDKKSFFVFVFLWQEAVLKCNSFPLLNFWVGFLFKIKEGEEEGKREAFFGMHLRIFAIILCCFRGRKEEKNIMSYCFYNNKVHFHMHNLYRVEKENSEKSF